MRTIPQPANDRGLSRDELIYTALYEGSVLGVETFADCLLALDAVPLETKALVRMMKETLPIQFNEQLQERLKGCQKKQ